MSQHNDLPGHQLHSKRSLYFEHAVAKRLQGRSLFAFISRQHNKLISVKEVRASHAVYADDLQSKSMKISGLCIIIVLLGCICLLLPLMCVIPS